MAHPDDPNENLEVPEADRLDQAREVPDPDAPVPPAEDEPIRPEDQRAP